MTLKELKTKFREFSFWPRKRLGQNFLVDEKISERIAGLLGEGKDPVIEIGGGFGSLTEFLVKRSGSLYVLEVDPALHAFLVKRFEGSGLILEKKDILRTSFKEYCRQPGDKISIIGNLPYAITSPILLHLIEQREFLREAVITVQQEVAERLTARPRTKAYGSLSCFVQCFTDCRSQFNIPPSAFYPVPEVNSEVVRLRFLETPRVSPKNLEFMQRVIRTGFGKRRKTLANALTDLGEPFSKEFLFELFRDLGFSEKARAEELALEEFARLSDRLIDFIP